MSHPDWSLQEAKNKFSAVVEAALAGTPQRVSRRGRLAVVVLAAEEFERLKQCQRAEAPAFSDALLDLPQDDGEFGRALLAARDIEF